MAAVIVDLRLPSRIGTSARTKPEVFHAAEPHPVPVPVPWSLLRDLILRYQLGTIVKARPLVSPQEWVQRHRNVIEVAVRRLKKAGRNCGWSRGITASKLSLYPTTRSRISGLGWTGVEGNTLARGPSTVYASSLNTSLFSPPKVTMNRDLKSRQSANCHLR